ncbi:programmed cell death protein 2-like [Elgaria multicarinata webbii]|uniref:programmed cell death protein 2-like n=1 Tax=Elgaria multicarinata webbii TaxID=159646 RepID=UPI002FCD5758
MNKTRQPCWELQSHVPGGRRSSSGQGPCEAPGQSLRQRPARPGVLARLGRRTHVARDDGGPGFRVALEPPRARRAAPEREPMAMATAAAAAPPVLLGLRDIPAAAGSCQAGLQLHGAASKVGGSPDCLPSVTLAHPACGICGTALMHVVQVYCPLEGSPFHRVINVFACATESCWGDLESWKVLRSQYLQVQGKGTQDCKLKQKQECVLAAQDWCEGADDWGEDNGIASSGHTTGHSLGSHPASDPVPKEDCANQFQDLSLREVPGVSHPFHSCDPPGEEQVMPSCVPLFQSYFISVMDEEDYRGCDDVGHAQNLLTEYQQREGLDLEQMMSDSYALNEKYEKSKAEKRDQVFHKFLKRISVCKEQILRYSWGGQPLFITCPSTDIKTAAPPCRNCNSRRIFEFQLMPTLVSMLKAGDDDVSVEFGTALVYTCEKSCWPTEQKTPLEEFVFIQEDPDEKLFK